MQCMSHLDTRQVMLETQPCNLHWTCINVCKGALKIILVNLHVLIAPACLGHRDDQPMRGPLSSHLRRPALLTSQEHLIQARVWVFLRSVLVQRAPLL